MATKAKQRASASDTLSAADVNRVRRERDRHAKDSGAWRAWNRIVGVVEDCHQVQQEFANALQEDEDRAGVGEVSGFETLEALHSFWLQKLSGPESRVLQVLITKYPSATPRADLAFAAGYTENGHFNNILGRLNSLGVAHYPTRGYVAAAAVLFPDALMHTRGSQ